MGSPDGRTRVLWLAKGLGPGGMERLLVNHARLGDCDRFDYHAAYLTERPNSVVPELEALGVECVRLGRGSGADPRWLAALRSLVTARGIDIVHSHSPLPAAMSRPMLRLRRHRPRLVYTEHNTWDCYGRATRLANLVTYPLDDAQFAVSANAAASPPERLARQVEVLTHGIDQQDVAAHAVHRERARADLGVDGSTIVIITVANLRTEKGYDVLFDAARSVLARHDDAVFICVGQGPLGGQLRDVHDRLGFGDRVRLLGFRSDALDLMAAADIFCLASRQEGLPVAYMESTALGLPAAVTSVGGLTDAVDDEVTGLLVPPEQPERLAAALGRLIDDVELRRTMAARSLESAARFDARIAVRRQEAVYNELVS